MSKFHSTVSRRTFMKALGLTGAGLGAAALTAPVFHDLDELTASGDMANPKKPWWIKERDLENPTVEIDWSLIKRFNSTQSTQSNNALYDANWTQELLDQKAAKIKWIKENQPGYTLKDFAYRDTVGLPIGALNPWVLTGTQIPVNTPEALGVPKYQGTPEENARMLRTALRTYGAFEIGYVPVTANVLKLMYSNGYTAEDTKTAYIDPVKGNVLPTQGITSIPIMAPEMLSAYKAVPSPLVRGIHEQGNRINGQVRSSGQRFLIQLGYQGINGSYGPMPPFLDLSGEGEMGRIGGQTISPTYGMTQTQNMLSTDLPLAPTHPIDAGIWKFCWTCANCAPTCPSSSNTDAKEPTWDPPASLNVNSITTPGVYYSGSGKKVFWNNMSTCKSYQDLVWGCNICMANCVFTHLETAMIHQVVKATLATTPVFDSFFKRMDRFFGYGTQKMFSAGVGPPTGTFNPKGVDWWTRELPPFSWDGRADESHAQ